MLLPYTTLFRSVIPAGIDHDQLGGLAPATFADGTPIPHGQLAKLLCDGEFHRVVFGPQGQVLDSGRTERLFTDRKSTRLNSSHVAISYAVFCLKKKTTDNV